MGKNGPMPLAEQHALLAEIVERLARLEADGDPFLQAEFCQLAERARALEAVMSLEESMEAANEA